MKMRSLDSLQKSLNIFAAFKLMQLEPSIQKWCLGGPFYAKKITLMKRIVFNYCELGKSF